MYLLELLQEEKQVFVGVFETKESGEEFVKNIPGYYILDNGYFEEEWIEYKKLDDLVKLEYKGNYVYLSKFSFTGDIAIIWQEISNLDQENKGNVLGYTVIDNYAIDNNQVEEYVFKRERNYKLWKQELDNKGIKYERQMYGSQDGEYIAIFKDNGWYKFLELDLTFVETNWDLATINQEIDSFLK